MVENNVEIVIETWHTWFPMAVYTGKLKQF